MRIAFFCEELAGAGAARCALFSLDLKRARRSLEQALRRVPLQPRNASAAVRTTQVSNRFGAARRTRNDAPHRLGRYGQIHAVPVA